MICRIATEDDLPAITDMACEFWDEGTVYEEVADWGHIYDLMALCLSHNLLCVLEDFALEGFCAGVKSPCLGSPLALQGAEVAWWINPEYRGKEGGGILFSFIENLAKKAGIKYWNMSTMESSSPEISTYYEKRGYTLNEKHYMRIF